MLTKNLILVCAFVVVVLIGIDIAAGGDGFVVADVVVAAVAAAVAACWF